MSKRTLVIAGMVVTLLLAGVVSYYASASPDGLEKVAAEQGFDEGAAEHDLADSPLADYGVQGVDDARLSVGLAGVIGVAITFALTALLVLAVRRRANGSSEADAGDEESADDRVATGSRG